MPCGPAGLCHLYARAHPSFRRRHFFQGRLVRGGELKDIHWLNPDGSEMSDDQWDQQFAHCLGAFLPGAGLNDQNERARPIEDDDFVLMINADDRDIAFTLPLEPGTDEPWTVLIATYRLRRARQPAELFPGDAYPLSARSLALLVRPRRPE